MPCHKLMTSGLESLDPILFSTHMKVSNTHGHVGRMTWRILTIEPFHSLLFKINFQLQFGRYYRRSMNFLGEC